MKGNRRMTMIYKNNMPSWLYVLLGDYFTKMAEVELKCRHTNFYHDFRKAAGSLYKSYKDKIPEVDLGERWLLELCVAGLHEYQDMLRMRVSDRQMLGTLKEKFAGIPEAYLEEGKVHKVQDDLLMGLTHITEVINKTTKPAEAG